MDPSELCILANLLASLQFRTGLVETMHLRADYSSGVCRAIRKAVFASGTPQ
ncbi:MULTISPECIES: hypothetical protein [unclassified Dietzia]|uniref:hypothetical protein n=1 Tax=unclassified Dietzia TaxID=2617939 RepID=UPI0015FC60E0|nr:MULTISPECIES: hypothetical protein [unclassified Dietzia]MBB1039823.1 hypothetical protein [Dietzia sp. Cai40]MBB1045044.1 hypothetical protein [Dietzia sp. DQ11-44]